MIRPEMETFKKAVKAKEKTSGNKILSTFK